MGNRESRTWIPVSAGVPGLLLLWGTLFPFPITAKSSREKFCHSGLQKKTMIRQLLSFLRALWGFLSWEHFSVAGIPVNVTLVLALENYFRCGTVSAYSYPLGRDPVQKCLPPLSALYWKETKRDKTSNTQKQLWKALKQRSCGVWSAVEPGDHHTTD